MNGDIELEIGAAPEPGGYVVRVLHSAAGGEPTGPLKLDVAAVLSKRELLEATVLASAVTRRSASLAEKPVRDVGQQLFEALFTGPVYGTYRASLGAAQQGGRRLRVVLRLTAPELAALPWEMLFDSETGTYLCRQEPLVRHVPAPYTPDPLQVRSPLRILGMVSAPRDLEPLDAEAEMGQLAEALAGPVAQGLVEVTWVPAATWAAVHARLLSGEWHVLHFVGHGGYDARTNEGVLALVGDGGRADWIEAGRFADLLGEAQPTPRLVVLNSCSSAQAGVGDLFSGTAAALARSGISAVAAMQFAVSDTAAIAFSRGFYTAIAHGRGVDEAARSGRISILGAPRSLEWVTPVLYLRGQATQLFTVTRPPAPASSAPAASAPAASAPASSTPGPSTGASAGGADAPAAHPTSPGHSPLASPLAWQPGESARRRQAELRALYIEARAELRLEHFETAIGLFDDLLVLDPGYSDAAALRGAAQRARQLADTYTLAVTAQDADDCVAAAVGYDQILQTDPAYRDVAARKEACWRQQQVADLTAELRQHAAVGEWQAVLDVNTELARLDPSSSDPDGLASRARATLIVGHPAAGHPAAGQAATAPPTADRIRGDTQVRAADGTLRPRLVQRISGGFWMVNALSWHPDGRRIAVVSISALARVYDVSGQKPKEELTVKAGDLAHKGFDVAFSPDGTRLATASLKTRIWDVATGRQVLELRDNWGIRVAFSPDGTLLATGGNDERARIWDAATGRKLLEIRHDDAVTSLAFSLDGTRFATGGKDRHARIWDAVSGQKLLEVGHDDEVNSVAFSPAGTQLMSGGNDKYARVWDAASGLQLREIRHGGAVTTVAFSPDGTKLATGSEVKNARVWDAASGQKLLEIGHDNALTRVTFSPDGTLLATASRDITVRIWSVADL